MLTNALYMAVGYGTATYHHTRSWSDAVQNTLGMFVCGAIVLYVGDALITEARRWRREPR